MSRNLNSNQSARAGRALFRKSIGLLKGYPEFDENQPRAADGTWGGGGGSSAASSSSEKPAGESGLRRAGRYALTAGALLGAAALGVVAAPQAIRLARRVGMARATRTASVATTSRLKDTIKARDVIVAARAKSAERQAYFTSQLAQGTPSRAQIKSYNAQIKRHTGLQAKFDAELRQLERQIKTLRRTKR